MSVTTNEVEEKGDEAPAFYTKEIAEMFDKAKDYINMKREKEEEVVRLSKDITWEAKRVIFNLHRFLRSDRVVQEARQRLNFIVKSERHFLGLARALDGQDKSMHYRRYTHCLQEFIEAFVFLTYLEKKRLPTYEEVRDQFIYKVPSQSVVSANTEQQSNESMEVDSLEERIISVPCTLNDYILGAADFTGELMKATVPTLTKPQWHTFLFQSFAMVREIYRQLQGVLCYTKDFKSKLRQMRSNVLKIESTVYKLKIKILVYGRLPDSKELEWIEESTKNESLSNTGGNASNNSRKYRNDNEDYEDSGVD